MDKLLTETETKVKEISQSVVEEKKESVTDAIVTAAPPQNNSYISSFADMTVADIKREEEKKKAQEAEAERLRLLEEEIKEEQQRAEEERTKEENLQETQEERVTDASVTDTAMTIEKPNYDLLESKVIKLKRVAPQKKKRSKKAVGLILACALGGAAIICVTNCVILDQMNSNFVQIEDSYNLKLGKYLRDIYNLDATKNSMEMIETYPEDLLDAGDLGQKSNWFDRLCNFIGGLFGG